jgi:hypothetical protein
MINQTGFVAKNKRHIPDIMEISEKTNLGQNVKIDRGW